MHSQTSRCRGCPDRISYHACGCELVESETCNPYGGERYIRRLCKEHTPKPLTPVEKARLQQSNLKAQLRAAKLALEAREKEEENKAKDAAELERLLAENQTLREELANAKAQLGP